MAFYTYWKLSESADRTIVFITIPVILFIAVIPFVPVFFTYYNPAIPVNTDNDIITVHKKGSRVDQAFGPAKKAPFHFIYFYRVFSPQKVIRADIDVIPEIGSAINHHFIIVIIIQLNNGSAVSGK